MTTSRGRQRPPTRRSVARCDTQWPAPVQTWPLNGTRFTTAIYGPNKHTRDLTLGCGGCAERADTSGALLPRPGEAMDASCVATGGPAENSLFPNLASRYRTSTPTLLPNGIPSATARGSPSMYVRKATAHSGGRVRSAVMSGRHPSTTGPTGGARGALNVLQPDAHKLGEPHVVESQSKTRTPMSLPNGTRPATAIYFPNMYARIAI